MATERDLEICTKYTVDGQTQESLALEYGITKVRVGQILKAAGLSKRDRGSKPDVRSVPLGILVKPGVKYAVENESAKEGKAMSKWVSDLIEQELINRGINFSIPKEPHLRLPLEG